MSGSPFGILEYFTADKAADAQVEASQTAAGAQNNATQVAKQIYDQTRSDFEPFRKVGTDAIPVYQRMLSGDYDMKESPAARYQLQQGTKALNRSLAARGGLGGGNAAQRLAELNSSVAATDWSNQYSRILDSLKLGTGASASMGAASSTYGNQVQTGAGRLGDYALQAGQARAGLYSGLGGFQSGNASNIYQSIMRGMNQQGGGNYGGLDAGYSSDADWSTSGADFMGASGY